LCVNNKKDRHGGENGNLSGEKEKKEGEMGKQPPGSFVVPLSPFTSPILLMQVQPACCRLNEENLTKAVGTRRL
jgi:hypothetical protein